MEKLTATFSHEEHEQSARDWIDKIAAATRDGLPMAYNGDPEVFVFELGMDLPWTQPDADIVTDLIIQKGQAALAAFKAAFGFDIQADLEMWKKEDENREDYEHAS